MGDELVRAPFWAWSVLGALLAILLIVDLVVHRGSRLRSRAAAITWTGVWIGVGLLFTFFVWMVLGGVRAAEYIAAYLVEKSLSLDNLFVILVIFRSLQIPHDNQRSVLSWGVLGALVFRLGFIFVGLAAIERYHWVVYVFAAILLWGAVGVFREDPAKKTDSKAARWLWRHLPATSELHGNAFFAMKDGQRVATPLFVALCAVELTDIAFAVDSVPAALAISPSSFVVYSSNALALLGLRSLYLVLDDAIGKLKYLHYGLAAVLAFAGAKLIISEWVEIPPLLSVGIIISCIGVSVWTSMRERRRETNPPPKPAERREPPAPPPARPHWRP